VSERTTPTVVWVLDALHRNGGVHLTMQLARRLVPQGVLGDRPKARPNDEVRVSAGERIESLSPSGRRLRSAIVPATAHLAALARQADVVANASRRRCVLSRECEEGLEGYPGLSQPRVVSMNSCAEALHIARRLIGLVPTSFSVTSRRGSTRPTSRNS
jgi:hypothetical protein